MNKRIFAIILCCVLGRDNICGAELGDDLKWKNTLVSRILPISALLGIGGYFVYKKIADSDFGYHYSETFSYETRKSVNKIEIDKWIGNINISYGDVSGTIIKYYQTKDIKYKISEENGIFKIKRASEGETSTRGIKNSKAVLKIIIPKKNKIDFNISGCTGNLSLENLESTYININHNCGNVSLKNITSDKIDIHDGSGNIGVKNLNAKNIKIKNPVGNVSGSIVGSEKDYMINTRNKIGNCNLKNSSSGSRSLDISKSVGNIDISFDNKKPTVVN